MLQLTKDLRGDRFLIKLMGSIEENVDFGALIGIIPPVKNVDVITKEVARINSVGVKAWIRYFNSLATQGIKLKFLECSTAIVEQINLISNFTCGGTVESLYVPFCCTKCNTELLGLFRSEDLQKINFEIPLLKCSKCGGEAAFDDIPDEYFGFLSR